MLTGVPVTGVFDKTTSDAVFEFQNENNLLPGSDEGGPTRNYERKIGFDFFLFCFLIS
jgi:hypothetical protein